MPPACRRRPLELEPADVVWDPHERFSREFELSGGRTQQHPLSAANAKNRVGNAHGGPKRRLCTCASYFIVIQPFVTANTNVPYTHATSRN